MNFYYDATIRQDCEFSQNSCSITILHVILRNSINHSHSQGEGGNHASVCTSFEMQKAMCFLCSAKKSKHQLFYINILNKFATEIKLGGVAMSQSNQMSSWILFTIYIFFLFTIYFLYEIQAQGRKLQSFFFLLLFCNRIMSVS